MERPQSFLVLIMQQIKPSLVKPTNFQHMLLRMLISRIILEVEIPVAEAQVILRPVTTAILDCG